MTIPDVFEVVGINPFVVAAGHNGAVVGPVEHIPVADESADIQDDGHVVTMFHPPKGVDIVVSVPRSQVDVSAALWRDASLLRGRPVVRASEVNHTLEVVGLEVTRGESDEVLIVVLVQGGGVCGWWRCSR